MNLYNVVIGEVKGQEEVNVNDITNYDTGEVINTWEAKYGIENSHLKDEEVLASDGNSIVYVVRDKAIIALIGVNDIVRDNAKEVISKLSKHKIETIMLTGDNVQTAKKIANEVGISKVLANVLPSDKATVVKDLKESHKFVMMCRRWD